MNASLTAEAGKGCSQARHAAVFTQGIEPRQAESELEFAKWRSG
jgi:hypothetical protein